jgi:alpha-L-fucosidase 2
VSLINTRGGVYLGWPIKLEWSSSDPSIATVNEYGIVDVHARGRVELTCTCEGVSGSVVLTVVEPAVAAAVGLPVPTRLLPAVQPGAPAKRTPEPPPVHRRSIERGSVRPGLVASLGLPRGTRRFLFQLAVGGATGGAIMFVLTRSPEEYRVVAAQRSAAPATQRVARAAPSPNRQAAVRAGPRSGVVVPTSVATPRTEPSARPDAPAAAAAESPARVVSEAAGSAVIAPAAAPTTPEPQPAPPVAPAAPSVSRVVVPSSPSQLAEGESVRLVAAGVDDRGEAIAGRSVTWKSENEDVATVDANGIVTARRPGTATIVASLGDRTARVTLTVGTGRAADPPAPSPAATRANSAAAALQVMRARVDEFVQALQERNGSRLAALYNAESPQDRRNLQALLDRLRRPEARLKASGPQLAAPEIREIEAVVDFQVPMSWTTPFGRVRSQTSTFRAVLEAGDDGWRLVGIRSIGKVD